MTYFNDPLGGNCCWIVSHMWSLCVLSTDTLTFGQEEVDPLTMGVHGWLLYQLDHSCHNVILSSAANPHLQNLFNNIHALLLWPEYIYLSVYVYES